jgi:hypothetical protein
VIDYGAEVQEEGYIRFERGPESMFHRVQFQDATGAILEAEAMGREGAMWPLRNWNLVLS